MKSREEWEAHIFPPPLQVGGVWDVYLSNNSHVHIFQVTENTQEWHVIAPDVNGGGLYKQIWLREWPLREDPLRKAVQEAQKKGADFTMQSIVEMDLHGGEQ